MGIMDFVEKAAGAFAADKALEAVDPNAGLLAKGAATIAGFEGVSKLKDALGGDKDEAAADENDGDETASADDDQGDDSA